MHRDNIIICGSFESQGTDGRYKDNRIPPKGFRIAEAAARQSEPVWHGSSAPGYFSAAEYAGGYDLVSMLNDFPPSGILVPGADRVEVTLNYQTTSREYIEFLYNEINGTSQGTLSGNGPGSGEQPYIIQSDPFFYNQAEGYGLRAWGDTIWDIWLHNRNEPGAAPITIASGQWDSSSPTAVEMVDLQGAPKMRTLWPIWIMLILLVSSAVVLLARRRVGNL